MIMVPGLDTDAHAPYDEPRGTCPRCTSAAVRHLVIGLPSGPPPADDPDWVEWVGCLHPGYDRQCEACGYTWDADDDGGATAE